MKTKLCECGCGQPTNIATMTSAAKGWKKGEPRRFLHGHHAKFTRRINLDTAFRIDRIRPGFPSPCKLWIRGKDKSGYGVVYWNRTLTPIHRFIYEQVRGPIPKGLVIDHLCGNRACSNIEHLQAVPRGVNNWRGEKPHFHVIQH